jgi:CRP-like cAMP-binding protein
MVSTELIMANFAMHVSLDPKEAAYVQMVLQQMTVKKNAHVLLSGAKCKNIYFVNKGCLRIYHTDQLGNEHNISFCPENWWAVDMSSFSLQLPAFYSISALVDSRLFYLNYHELEKLYKMVPKFERFFRILTL